MIRICIALVFLAACGAHLRVEPVKVEPIHLTIDVNVHDSVPDAADGPAVSTTR